MEHYLHPYFSVYHFRLAYAGIIKPLPDKSQWPKVELDYKLLAPLTKREVGRQKKNRIPGCLENKGNKPKGKGAWQVTCSTCFQHGHRSSSSKCLLNGTKKRKSRAKVGRPLGSGKGDASTSSPKRQKLAKQTGEGTSSPSPVTRSQTAEGTSSPGPVSTPRKSPAKKMAAMKKLTPRKPKK
ncbi:unnamed protein product [Urochloa humidicola]